MGKLYDEYGNHIGNIGEFSGSKAKICDEYGNHTGYVEMSGGSRDKILDEYENYIGYIEKSGGSRDKILDEYGNHLGYIEMSGGSNPQSHDSESRQGRRPTRLIAVVSIVLVCVIGFSILLKVGTRNGNLIKEIAPIVDGKSTLEIVEAEKYSTPSDNGEIIIGYDAEDNIVCKVFYRENQTVDHYDIYEYTGTGMIDQVTRYYADGTVFWTDKYMPVGDGYSTERTYGAIGSGANNDALYEEWYQAWSLYHNEPFGTLFKELHEGMSQEEIRNILGRPYDTYEGTYYDGEAYVDDDYLDVSFLGKKVDVCFTYSATREISYVEVTFDPAKNGDLKPFESELLEYCNKNYGTPTWSDAEEGWYHDYLWACADYAIFVDSWVDDGNEITLTWMTKAVYEEEFG